MGVLYINIEKYPQYELYKFTKQLYENKEELIPENCDNRCVFSTIINRCYYSAYLYVSLWLQEVYKFKPLSKEDFGENEFITEHRQVQYELLEVNQYSVRNKLYDLFNLRKKADYDPFYNISEGELDDAMYLMEQIFKTLKIWGFMDLFLILKKKNGFRWSGSILRILRLHHWIL